MDPYEKQILGLSSVLLALALLVLLVTCAGCAIALGERSSARVESPVTAPVEVTRNPAEETKKGKHPAQ